MIGKAAFTFALAGTLAAIAATPALADAASGRVGAIKGRCLTQPQILAKLRRAGYRPVGRIKRRGQAYEIKLGRRGTRAGQPSTAIVHRCTGKIIKLHKAKLAAPGMCKSKASIVSKFDALGYYHIQVFGPMTLAPPPAGYTGKVYSVRAWTKTPPKCPWNFAVKCSTGEILTQTPDAC